MEGMISNARYTIGSAVVDNTFGDSDGGEIRIVGWNPSSLSCYLHCIGGNIAGNVIIQISRLKIVCPKQNGGH